MKNLFVFVALALSLLAPPSFAAVSVVNNNIVWFDGPSDITAALSGYCDTGNLAYNKATGTLSIMQDCAGSAYLAPALPVAAANVNGLTTLLNSKQDVPAGTTAQYLRGDASLATFPTNLSAFTNGPGYLTSSALSSYLSTSLAASTYQPLLSGTAGQYVKGDGTLGTLPTAGSRTWATPSRTVGSCFQISATNDADFHYKVDVSSGTLLQATATGTVTATSYTNSGCTTGARIESDAAPSQSAALGILSVGQTAPASLDGTLQAGRWLKITTAQTVGTPTFAIRANQTEITLP